jgi:ribosomal protein S21
MSYVALREGETLDSLISRFRIAVLRAGILSDDRNHRFFQSRGQKARMAVRRGIKRAAKRQRSQRTRE